jgi:cytochrome b6-f complex iron-sulfur subunit
MSSATNLNYGPVHGQPPGEISRRTFMRRMLGFGVGLLSLEFLGGTLAFLYPNLTGGLGGDIEIGSAADIVGQAPDWPKGEPYTYQKARLFFVNVPAGKDLVDGKTANVADPGNKVDETLPLADRSVLALYRKCPHLGCQIPPLCDKSHWFECLCHGSKYTILGEKRDGPAPRGMDHFPVSVNAKKVYVVDTGAKVTGPPVGTVTFDPRSPSDLTGQHCSG